MTAKKTSKNNPISKKVAKKKLAKKGINKTSTLKPKPAREIVRLPSNVSLRSLNKAKTIVSMIDKDFARPAQTIAYVGGGSFLLLGAVLMGNPSTFTNFTQSASLISFSNSILMTSVAQENQPALIIGLSILALGVILFILGFSLRKIK